MHPTENREGRQVDVAIERSRTDRRQWRGIALVYPERRTGFDRRISQKLLTRYLQFIALWLRDSGVLPLILLSINLLSVADLAMTLHLFGYGAIEGNPVLAWLFTLDPVIAGAVKLALILTITAILWRTRRYKTVLLLAIAVFAIFLAVITYEVYLLILVV